jgi:prevent-host-death family protein
MYDARTTQDCVFMSSSDGDGRSDRARLQNIATSQAPRQHMHPAVGLSLPNATQGVGASQRTSGLLQPCIRDYLQVMSDHKKGRVGVAELKARLSMYLRAVRRGEAVIVYDRDTPVARLVPYEGGAQATLPVRKATEALRDVELPEPLGREIDSLAALAEERQAGR